MTFTLLNKDTNDKVTVHQVSNCQLIVSVMSTNWWRLVLQWYKSEQTVCPPPPPFPSLVSFDVIIGLLGCHGEVVCHPTPPPPSLFFSWLGGNTEYLHMFESLYLAWRSFAAVQGRREGLGGRVVMAEAKLNFIPSLHFTAVYTV